MPSKTATTLKVWGDGDIKVTMARRPGRSNKGRATWFELDGVARPPLKSALGQINKPAMVNWAKKRAFGSVERVLADYQNPGGHIDTSLIMRRAAEEFEERGRDWSNTLGRLIMEQQAGIEPTVPQALQPAWDAYMEWIQSTGIALEFFKEPQVLLNADYGLMIQSMGWRHDRAVIVNVVEANAFFPEHAMTAHAMYRAVVDTGAEPWNEIWVLVLGKDLPTFKALDVQGSLSNGLKGIAAAVDLYNADIASIT